MEVFLQSHDTVTSRFPCKPSKNQKVDLSREIFPPNFETQIPNCSIKVIRTSYSGGKLKNYNLFERERFQSTLKDLLPFHPFPHSSSHKCSKTRSSKQTLHFQGTVDLKWLDHFYDPNKSIVCHLSNVQKLC